LMRLAKVGEGHHAGQQSDATPPEVCGLGAAEMTVNTLMGHDRANKYQVGSKQDVEAHEKGIGERNKQCSDREEDDETDDYATEIVDFVTMMHVGECSAWFEEHCRECVSKRSVPQTSCNTAERGTGSTDKTWPLKLNALYLALCQSTKYKALIR